MREVYDEYKKILKSFFCNKFYIISNIQGDKPYAVKKLPDIRYNQRRKNCIN